MGKPIIRILDVVHCRANKEARELILPALAYKATTWKRGKFGKRENAIVKQHLITGRKGSTGLFLTGLVPRIKEYCKKRGHDIKVIGREERIRATRPPSLKGITFRADQLKALRAAKHGSRGRIVFPTGSGKTLIALGVHSMFEEVRTLFLCHTKDLLTQSADEAKKYFKTFVLGGGHKPDWKKIKKENECIVVATIQTFAKLDPDLYSGFFDILIVDEVHHANAGKSQYGKVIQNMLAPRRYGLTATTPTKSVQYLTNEGFFGKVIAELTEQVGQEAGIIAKVDLNLVPVPYNVKLNKKCQNRYRNYYDYCIVQNRERNVRIVNEVKKSMEAGEQTLIIVESIKHGNRLNKMIMRRLHIPCFFVHGSTDKAKREVVLQGMKKQELRLAIASRVWKEGINIPSLNHIINAVGMKEEKAVIQTVGRGLRTTKDKDTVKLTDFLDPYPYLSAHSILRLHVYSNKGWL